MKKLNYSVEHGMVRNDRGVIEVVLGNQIIVRVGNDSDRGVNLRSGTKAALTLAAEKLREVAERMEAEARNV